MIQINRPFSKWARDFQDFCFQTWSAGPSSERTEILHYKFKGTTATWEREMAEKKVRGESLKWKLTSGSHRMVIDNLIVLRCDFFFLFFIIICISFQVLYVNSKWWKKVSKARLNDKWWHKLNRTDTHLHNACSSTSRNRE